MFSELMTKNAPPVKVLSTILPSGVHCSEMDDTAEPDALYPEEYQSIATAVLKRRMEFARGRTCARRAMFSMGEQAAPLLRLPSRAPAWPQGVIGSLTHCAGYVAAAVASTQDFRALGIDAEPNDALPAEVLSVVASTSEQALLRLLPEGGVHWDRLLFSAKESIFKAWSPLTGARLDFLDAELTINPAEGSFHGCIGVQHLRGVSSFDGRFAFSRKHLFTAVTLPR